MHRNESLRLLVSDEYGVIPASTRLQVSLATVASTEKNVTFTIIYLHKCQLLTKHLIHL